MKIALACVEDGLMQVGVRKMAALMETLEPDIELHYVPYGNSRSLRAMALARYGDCPDVPQDVIREMAEPLARADLVAFSSMTAYSGLTAAIIRHVRALNPAAYVVWGGIHPIIVPEDAVQHADAVCTGEGELAFTEFFEAFREGRDFTGTRNFWFRRGEKITRNGFLPLMTGEQMSALPGLRYGRGERIYERSRGWVPLETRHYLAYNGLSYNTVWSIGCPFHCTYCGNTRFIENDAAYRKIRHPSVDSLVGEIESALRVHPHISTVVFHDDSFMALPPETLAEFARKYSRRIDLPFCVQGVIPNYVKEDKLRILLGAGMNRVRMGIESGSERILKFYDRPTPPKRIRSAARTLSRYRRYMIPPAYDVILDNPIETRADVVETLELLWGLPRPFTLNVFSLRSIPNTRLAEQMKEMHVSVPGISANYTHTAPTLANCLVFLIAAGRVPRWLFRLLLRGARPATAPQPRVRPLAALCRGLYLARRAADHLRFLDFSVMPGRAGYVLWSWGVIDFWRRRFVRRYEPSPSPGSARSAGPQAVEVAPPRVL